MAGRGWFAMNPLRVQALVLALLSMPFAVRGYVSTDTAAWATAFAAVLSAGAVVSLDWATENGTV